MKSETSRLIITTAISTLVLGGLSLGAYFTVKNPAPGTTIAGITISETSDAARVIDEVADRFSALPVRVDVHGRSHRTKVRDLGVRVDKALMVTIAQQHTGFTAWFDAISTGSANVELEVKADQYPITLTTLSDSLTKEPVNGNVTIAGREVRTFAAEKGEVITPDAIITALIEEVKQFGLGQDADWPDEIVIRPEIRVQDPPISQMVVDETAKVLNERLNTPFVVVNPKTQAELTLGPEALSGLLTVTPEPEAKEPLDRLVITAPSELPPAPSPFLAFIGEAVKPEDATIQVQERSSTPVKGSSEEQIKDVSTVTGKVVYEPGDHGVVADVAKSWEAVGKAMANGQHRTPLVIDEARMHDLSAIGISAPISTFTTYFTPDQQRNINIKRIAELVNGTIIMPGQTYELNHAVGERTAAKGFVEGGAIFEGKMTTSIGGGVSQFATTFFNAMWFAGVQINTFKPHTYYFDRYPLGREATIDYPGVNLEMANTTPYAILVEATTTEDSVTVTFWSTPYFTVKEQISKPIPTKAGGTVVRLARTATAPDGKVDQFNANVYYHKKDDA